MFFRARWLTLALGLLLIAAACSDNGDGSDGPADTGGNLFGNGDFEQGKDPWFSLKPPDFILTDDVSLSGSHSAYLRLEAGTQEEKEKIIYLVQEVAPQEFPEVISGAYRVEDWNKGTEKQYLQFVVIVFGADNLTEEFGNHQIRYILAGIDSPPFGIANAKFVFLSQDEPVQGEWVPFQRNLREDFEQAWGAAPEGFDNIRVLFEVRYDGKVVGEGPLDADVYYDDLYLGPAPAPSP